MYGVWQEGRELGWGTGRGWGTRLHCTIRFSIDDNVTFYHLTQKTIHTKPASFKNFIIAH